jgi:hypothetical protein
MERGHRARWRARDRARRGGGAAGELQEVGVALAYANVRYGGTVAAPAAPPASVIPISEVPFATVQADDTTVFPAPRPAFLRAWICSPGHVGRALVRDGRLAAWGVVRQCRTGRKIGPLVADDRATAEVVLAALLADTGGGEIFLDVPSVALAGQKNEAYEIAERFDHCDDLGDQTTSRPANGLISSLPLRRCHVGGPGRSFRR